MTLDGSPGQTAVRTALLLLNTGTPDDPSTGAVRRYLRQFLSDPRVIEGHPLKRRLLVEGLILPMRATRSAAQYRKIFTERGSPLLFHSQELARRLQQVLGEAVIVDVAMRYGRPSIESQVARLVGRGVDRIVAFPLFPQAASASTGAALEALYRACAGSWNVPSVQVVAPFFDHPAFIEALAERAAPTIEQAEASTVIFSYHGLPLSHLRRSAELGEPNRFCYREQCLATTRALGERLGVADSKRVLAFQSRMGRARWLGPYLNDQLKELPRRGVKRAVLISPSFVADCLETLEELQQRAVELFLRNGGERLEVVESLNASDRWVQSAAEIAQQASRWL